MYHVRKGRRRIISRYKMVDSGFRTVWNVFRSFEKKPMATCNKKADAENIADALLRRKY